MFPVPLQVTQLCTYGIAKAAMDHMTRMVALGKQITQKHSLFVSSLFDWSLELVSGLTCFIFLHRNGWQRRKSQQCKVSNFSSNQKLIRGGGEPPSI